jgi:hypothetical protein
MGEWKRGSWGLYYVWTTLFKTPESTLIASLLGLFVLVNGIRRKIVDQKIASMFLFVGVPAIAIFCSISFQGGFNHHHRYVLPIYPFIFFLAALVSSSVMQELLSIPGKHIGLNRKWMAIPLGASLCMLSIVSTLRVHPYYTSYFNTLSGGPKNGWHLLGFSNIDWGQDVLRVDEWIRRHPVCRPLCVDLGDFGLTRSLLDTPCTEPPLLPKGGSIDDVRTEETQWWIISVTKLYNLPEQKGLEYLQELEPVERIAYANHVYRIDPRLPNAK